MFYAAEALLEGEGMAFSSHAAVIGAFGKHFARTSRVPSHLHGWLSKAMDLRHAGDYGSPGAITVAEAEEQVDRAESFIQQTRRVLGQEESKGS